MRSTHLMVNEALVSTDSLINYTHYGEDTWAVMVSHIAGNLTVLQQFSQIINKKIKARSGLLALCVWGEPTGHRWIILYHDVIMRDFGVSTGLFMIYTRKASANIRSRLRWSIDAPQCLLWLFVAQFREDASRNWVSVGFKHCVFRTKPYAKQALAYRY